MITHIVLMKFKDENKGANLQEGRERLLAMRGRVESLLNIEVGLNVVASERAFDLALTTRHADLAGLALYANDPVHVEVKKFLAGVLQVSYVVDYESA